MIAKDELRVLLGALSAQEWLWLDRFMESPYHNSDERLIHLNRLMKAAAPDFVLNEQAAYKLCFSGSVFVARKWADLIRKYLRKLHEFLEQQELKKRPSIQAFLGIEGRKRRKLYHLLPAQIDTYAAAIDEEQLPPWDAANARRVRWQQQYELPGQFPEKKDILELTEFSRLTFCLLELRYRIEQQIDFEDDYQKNQAAIDPVITLAKRLSARWPLLQLNLLIYEAVCEKTPDQDLIDACEASYYQLFPTLYPYDRTFFFTKLFILLNRSTINQELHGRKRLFQLLKFAVEEDIYLEAEKMTEQTFLNICSIGIAEGELDWVEQFRKRYLPWVATGDVSNISLLSEAFLTFARGDYGAVYRLSSLTRRLPLGQRIQMYGVQIKALTELYLADRQNANPLRDYLRSADRFLRYHKEVHPRMKVAFLNLIKILRKMIVLCERGERTPTIRKRLMGMQEAADSVVLGEWLSSKIAQL